MKQRYKLKNMNREEILAAIKERLDEASELWYEYASTNDFGFADLSSRLNDPAPIVRPIQR